VEVIRKSKGRVEYAETRRLISVCGINRELAVLRRGLNIAHEWKVIPSIPRIHLLPGEKVSERNVTHEEQRAYLEAAPEALRDFTVLAVGTGFRPEEILTMRWDNVRFDPVGAARLGYVHNPQGKTIKAKRNVPMSADVRAVLQKRHEAAGSPRWGYVFGGPTPIEHLSYSAIKGQHERTMKRLKDSPETKNFPKTRIYDWRHTALTRLGESGADSFVIQKVAGHSSIITSSKYVHPTSERLEDAFDRLQAYNDRKHERIEAAQNAVWWAQKWAHRAKPGKSLPGYFVDSTRCRRADSNRRPKDYETFALTT
jgi:integrase